MSNTGVQQAEEVFTKRLTEYKKLLDDDIEAYSKYVRQSTLQTYGKHARLESDAFLSVLERGGKRIRGALVILGYEMSGGKMDKAGSAMITQAARAIEMLHAYLLILDDIQDRSAVRRGGPSAHYYLADYHRKQQLSGDSDHFGVAIALNSAIGGAHAANMILANLDAPQQLRLNVLSIVNRTLLVTAHGQTEDIMSEVSASVSEQQVENLMEWKTSVYTILNPLHVGMVLAGADCHATDAITPYAMNIGKAFQVTDDILGTFGNKHETGKSPMDDIREGKRTLLTVYALEHATNGNKNFLIQSLGNDHLTQAGFERCKEIISGCGALDFARRKAEKYISDALASLDQEAKRWDNDGVLFLRGLADYLLGRQT